MDLADKIRDSVFAHPVWGNVVKRLVSLEPQIWIVGGAVRDIILDRFFIDVDIVCIDDPKTITAKLAGEFGLADVTLDSERRIFRLARNDKPGSLDLAIAHGGNLQSDLLNRDFTINAMAVPFYKNAPLMDPLDGAGDLKKGMLRPVSDNSIKSDPVRILRAYRFAADFDLYLSANLTEHLHNHAQLLELVAGERVFAELCHILNNNASHNMLIMMERSGVLDVVFPEIVAMKGVGQNRFHQWDVFEHTMRAYGRLEKEIGHPPNWPGFDLDQSVPRGAGVVVLLKLAMLYHDAGKPGARCVDDTGRVTFFNHEMIGVTLAKKAARRLKVSRRLEGAWSLLVKNHLRPFNALGGKRRLTARAAHRFARELREWTYPALLLAMADSGSKREELPSLKSLLLERDAIDRVVEARQKLNTPDGISHVVTGDDIMHHFDVGPGPHIGRALRIIDEALAAGEVRDSEGAYRLIGPFINKSQ